MKTKTLFLILFIANILLAKAQMDEMFYFPSKTIQPIDWDNYKELQFPVDQDSISILILKPKEKLKATILYFHGTGGNNSYYFPLIQPMLDKHYQVVMIDFRGYGKSTGTPTHNNIATDGQKILDTLLKIKGIRDTKIILYGASIGSQIATHLAKNNQHKIDGLILEGGMSSFGDIAAYYTPEHKEFLEDNYPSPYSAKEDIIFLNELPKLIIHSKEDKDVPYSQGRVLFENAPDEKVFLEFSGEHLRAIKYENTRLFYEISRMLQDPIE